MRIRLLLLITSCTLVSCKSESQKQAETIQNNIVSYLNGFNKENGNDMIVDSVRILSIDLLNEKKDSLLSYESNINYNVALQNEVDRLQDLMDGNQLRLNDDLVIDLPSSVDLTQSDFDNAFHYKMKIMELSGVIEKLDSTINSGKLDTLEATGYLTKVKVFAHDSKKANRDLVNQEFRLDKNLLVIPNFNDRFLRLEQLIKKAK